MQQKLLWELRRMHLEDWVYSLVKRFKEQAWNQKQILLFKISGILPLFAFDRSSLELILMGLLKKVCKYTPLTEKINVVMSTKLGNSFLGADNFVHKSERLWLELRVSYCGDEIPASELLPVLDQFYPMSNVDSGQMSETDLELLLVKKLIEKLGGIIHIESSSQRTCFTVQLPQSD